MRSPAYFANRIARRLASVEQAWITAKWKRQFRKELCRFEAPYKLHVGCGHVKLQGWINIDIAVAPEVADVHWDITRPFPIEGASCSHIYHEHLLEHLSVDRAVLFLRECVRLLAPGGIMRVAMPSLAYVVGKYSSETWHDQDWLTWPQYQFIRTRAEMINVAFRWWDHRWLYDREELARRLCDAGFASFRCFDFGKSEDPQLINLETRKDSKLICEAVACPLAQTERRVPLGATDTLY